MSLVSMEQLLAKAGQGGYLLAAWDTWGESSVQAVLETAEELRSPAILAVAPHYLPGFDLACYATVAKLLANRCRVPVALHLDECPDTRLIMECIQLGFTSVMYDGSRLPLQENIASCQHVVKAAHAEGVTVEAQVGVMPEAVEGRKTSDAACAVVPTSLPDAVRFVQATDVDALAVSVGSVHMLFHEKIQSLDLDLAQRISAATNTPLVLHGGTGVDDQLIPKIIQAGFRKVNIGTALYGAYDEGLASSVARRRGAFSTWYALQEGKRSLKELIRNKMRVYGSVGRV